MLDIKSVKVFSNDNFLVIQYKESEIKNDTNNWLLEVRNPRYILDLLLSVINVIVQTMEIVEGLPKVNFE